jgi:hypothetical protein
MAFARSSRAHQIHFPWHPIWHTIERSLRASLLVALGVVVGFLLATTAVPHLRSAAEAVHASTQVVQPRTPELPREWRWERDAVSFDDMYRPGTRSPGLAPMYRRPR